MRWILALITIITLLLAAVVVIGGLLSPGHEASRAAELPAEPDAVFAIISAIEDSARWRPEVYEVRRLPGPTPAGPGGARYREVGVHGPVTVAIVEAAPPTRLVLAVSGAGPGFEGTWTFALEPIPTGTRVTLTERGEIENPVFRFLSRYLVGYTTSIDAYLAALTARLAQGS
ncbi:MAG: SRPBCC family protein [Haliangiales bacterium]